LLALRDRRISKDGIIIIKAQSHRSQDKNREDAMSRLQQLVNSAMIVRKNRRATKPTRGSQRRRMDSKTKRGQVKSLRGKVKGD
jgi:ribosome-associated protein